MTLPDVALAELTASAVDFVWIDLEHGALAASHVQPLAIAARAGGAAALVRLPAGPSSVLARALDAGVDGVVVPNVEHGAQAARVVEWMSYPPAGSRGLAARRASAYGALADPAVPVCVAQIESAAGVRAAAEIAAVPGVDALVIGAADLAMALGEPLRADSPRLAEAIGEVRRRAEAAGVEFGVAGPATAGLLAELAGEGAQQLVLGADVRLYAHALRAEVAALRDEPAPRAPEQEEAHVGT